MVTLLTSVPEGVKIGIMIPGVDDVSAGSPGSVEVGVRVPEVVKAELDVLTDAGTDVADRGEVGAGVKVTTSGEAASEVY